MQTHQKHCGIRYGCSCEQAFNEKRKLTLHLAECTADVAAGGGMPGVEHKEMKPDPGAGAGGGGDGGGGDGGGDLVLAAGGGVGAGIGEGGNGDVGGYVVAGQPAGQLSMDVVNVGVGEGGGDSLAVTPGALGE